MADEDMQSEDVSEKMLGVARKRAKRLSLIEAEPGLTPHMIRESRGM